MCNMVSMTHRYDRILGFVDFRRYYFFQVAPQLCSRDGMDPVPDPLLLRKSGSDGNRTRTSESVAKKSEHQTTEDVISFQIIFKNSVRTSLETHYFSATHITPLTAQLYSRG
jgi:hypothetical protein